MKNFSNTIPMETKLLEKYESPSNDIRFTKVKIWLMHLGLNRNGSIFTKEVVQKAIPSLANTPIMASVGLNTWGVKDFEGHESDIEVSEDGELRFINKTFPFGVIPENNNAKFETRVGDDMVEREYLTVEGLLWNKWEDAVDILYGKHGVAGQSMELSDEYKGYFDGENFEFTEFQFFGACLLGDEVLPAMNNSTVELKYADSTKKYIDEKLKVFNTINFESEQGGKTLAKGKLENKIVEETKFEEAEETTEEIQSDLDGADEEEVKVETEAETEDISEVEEEAEVEEQEEAVADFPAGKDSVTIEEQSIEKVAEIKAKEKEIPNPTERILIAGIEYSVEDLEKLVKDFNELSTKYSTLQADVHSEKVEGLFNKYSNVLDKEDVAELKADASKLSIEDLETKIFAVIGRKSFSAKKVEQEQPEIKFSQIKLSTGKVSTGNKLDDLVNKL